VIVEGNTDVIALRQAGFEPVVASMGTALTEAQLRELKRLTHHVIFCFDADAAGDEATLRGMELATKDFSVGVVVLPNGLDPADDPAVFMRELAQPVSYLVHRVRLLHRTAPDRVAGFDAIRAFLNRFPESPEHLDARMLAADLLRLPKETQVALVPRSQRTTNATISPKLLEAGTRLERSALAGVAAHPELGKALEQMGPEHFESELHRRVRATLVGEPTNDPDVIALVNEFHALATLEELDHQTSEQLLLRLRERRLQRQLQEAKPDHFLELQQRLAEVRDAIREFA
jgi:DNA primase